MSHSRLPASQWDESRQTGPRRREFAPGKLDGDWTSRGTLGSLDQPEKGIQASQEDHPEDILDLQSPNSNGYD